MLPGGQETCFARERQFLLLHLLQKCMPSQVSLHGTYMVNITGGFRHFTHNYVIHSLLFCVCQDWVHQPISPSLVKVLQKCSIIYEVVVTEPKSSNQLSHLSWCELYSEIWENDPQLLSHHLKLAHSSQNSLHHIMFKLQTCLSTFVLVNFL